MSAIERMRCPAHKVALPLPPDRVGHAFPRLQRSATSLTLWFWRRTPGVFEPYEEFVACAVEGCGRKMRLFVIDGRPGKQECGERCLSATGPACECKCAGENHGGGSWAA